MTEKGKDNIRKARLGKKHSPQTKMKISLGMLRYWQMKKRLECAKPSTSLGWKMRFTEVKGVQIN